MSLVATININIDPIAVCIESGGVHRYGVLYVVAFAVAFRFGAWPHQSPAVFPVLRATDGLRGFLPD